MCRLPSPEPVIGLLELAAVDEIAVALRASSLDLSSVTPLGSRSFFLWPFRRGRVTDTLRGWMRAECSPENALSGEK